MSTVIKPEISEKNEYWISRDRFYELKHFCLQYKEWKKIYYKLESDLLPKCVSDREKIRLSGTNNPTERIAILRSGYLAKINMVESTAKKADPELADYILKAVTENKSFSYLQTVLDMPCSRNTFYDRFRKFFWLLSQERD